MHYLPIIGLEIHVQPKTHSKMFCGCSADIFGAEPNTYTCPVCFGLPGALPVPNKRAVEATIQLGLAVGAEIAQESKFDRKNYFYPDLPKGYQISQYDQPIATGGFLTITDPQTGDKNTITFTRVHLEEDTGKLIHSGDGYTLIDFNRSGMPLIEIVTDPVIHSAAVMKLFLKRLRLILRYAGISDADMEKGTMRIEPNISVAQVEEEVPDLPITNVNKDVALPSYKVELKNINSFRFAERAVEFEIARQINLLKKGETPVQETRGWNEDKGITVSQRRKEEAHDYRYFPEPDIPPLHFDDTYIQRLREHLPPLPDTYEKVFLDVGLEFKDIETILEKPELLAYTQAIIERTSGEETKQCVMYAINHPDVLQVPVDAFLEKLRIEADSKIADMDILRNIAHSILTQHPSEVERYKNGKVELFGFFMGKIMTETQGKADAQAARETLQRILSE